MEKNIIKILKYITIGIYVIVILLVFIIFLIFSYMSSI